MIDHGHRAVWDGVDRRQNKTADGAGAKQPIDVEDAEGKDENVDKAKYNERDRRRACRKKRRQRVRRAQHAIDGPRLASYLGCEPAGQDGDVRQGKTEEDAVEERAILLDAVLDAEIVPIHARSSMIMPQPTMTRNAKNGMSTGGRS